MNTLCSISTRFFFAFLSSPLSVPHLSVILTTEIDSTQHVCIMNSVWCTKLNTVLKTKLRKYSAIIAA